jgi:hypothetical protein
MAAIEFVDLLRFRRPYDTGKVHAARAPIKGEGYLSQKKLAHMLGIYHETVKDMLRDDPIMRKINFKWGHMC